MRAPVLLALWCASLLLPSCGTAPAGRQTPPHGPGAAHVDAGAPTPLILAHGEGERRVRRYAGPASVTTIKVDPRNGGSSELVMVHTDIPPGGRIPRHWHRIADEIVFVHRGSGVVELGATTQPFGTGATIYIPREVRVAVRNTGPDTLSTVFVFSGPGFEQFLRETSVLEGEPVVPLSAEEMVAIRRRHEWHMVSEEP